MDVEEASAFFSVCIGLPSELIGGRFLGAEVMSDVTDEIPGMMWFDPDEGRGAIERDCVVS